jgi:hypothetical protein
LKLLVRRDQDGVQFFTFNALKNLSDPLRSRLQITPPRVKGPNLVFPHFSKSAGPIEVLAHSRSSKREKNFTTVIGPWTH